MATSTRTQVSTKRVVEVIDTETKVTLVLSNREATALAVVLANVGGSPEFSPRHYTDRISDALHDVGISGCRKTGQPRFVKSSLMFGEATRAQFDAEVAA